MVNRRQFVKAVVAAGAAGLIGATLSTIRSAFPFEIVEEWIMEEDLFRYRKVEGAWFEKLAGMEAKKEHFDKIDKGASVLWNEMPAILIRIDEKKINSLDGVEDGFIAFLAKCTHLCCIPTYKLDEPSEKIFCRCHNGVFDPYIIETTEWKGVKYRGAKVLSGPPPVPLPQIPVKIKDNFIYGVAENLKAYNYCRGE